VLTKIVGYAVAGVGLLIVLFFSLADFVGLSNDAASVFGPRQLLAMFAGVLILVAGLTFSRNPMRWLARVKSERLEMEPSRGRFYYTFFFLNAIYVLTLLYLTALTALYVRVSPIPPFTIIKAALVGVLAVFVGLVALRSERRGNLILFFVITLALLIPQVGYLSPFLESRFPAGVTRHPTPNVTFAGKPNVEGHNALGYRGDLPPTEKGEEYRVFMLGGSTVYNGGSGTSLPEQLESMVHENGSGQTVVYNWGVVSASSAMEISTILHRVVNYQPDLVILYDGGNDVLHPYLYDPRPGYPFNFLLYERVPAILQEGDLATLSAMMMAQSDLARTFFAQELENVLAPVQQVREEVDYGSQQWEEEITDAYLHNVERACFQAKGFDFRLAVFLQPMGFLSPQRSDLDLIGDEDLQSYGRRQYDQIATGFDELNAEYGGNGRCAYVDLSRLCEGDNCIFTDYVHVTPETRTYIAGHLYRHLSERDLVS
jgi:hypothetical protein